MRDIEKLERDLSYDEYLEGRTLFTALKQVGLPSTKAAALCYRAGLIDARAEAKERARERYQQRQVAKTTPEPNSPPEANTGANDPASDEEGSTANE